MSVSFVAQSIEKTRRIVLKYAPAETRIFLFGSRARGQGLRGSDVDVGFLGKKPVEKIYFSRIHQELEESSVPFQVDLVDFFGKSERFRKIALKKTILWKS